MQRVYGVKPSRNERERIPDACAIAAIANIRGKLLPGSSIVEMLKAMRPRYNGLGAGFAGYGIYPDFSDEYVLHLMFDDWKIMKKFEDVLRKHFRTRYEEEIPTRSIFDDHPILWRYFLDGANKHGFEERLFEFVMYVNDEIDGAYIVSSGRNMGIFKGVGKPVEIAEFYKLDQYMGVMWLGHGRYPTNTPGWWGGAHPFNVLNTSVVHNGEISSYGISKRYLESKGYRLIFLTDSEMLSYSLDYLIRRERLSIDKACCVLSPPYWDEIERWKRSNLKILRIKYQELHINGPASFAASLRIGDRLYLMALTDRLKLRPLVTAQANDLVFISSEECGIRAVERKLDKVWRPKAGEPVMVEVVCG